MMSKEFCLEQLNMKVELMVKYGKEGRFDSSTDLFNQADGMLDAFFFCGVLTEDEYMQMGENLTKTWLKPETWGGEL